MLVARRLLLTSSGLTLACFACDGDRALNEPGAPAPSFALEDFQPQTPDGILDRYYDYGAGRRVDPISVAGKAALRDALVAAGA